MCLEAKMKISTTRLIKLIDNSYQSEINQRLKNSKITQSQAEILIYIKVKSEQGKEVNQIDLEKSLNLTNPTITGILNRLEEKGFVKRIVSIKDSRFKSVLITEQGKEELSKGKKVIDKLEKKMLNYLTVEEQIELHRLLEKLWNQIS